MDTNQKLEQIKELLEELTGKLSHSNNWPENNPFCHHFINLDDNVRYIHRQYPSFRGSSINIVKETENGLTFQVNDEIVDVGEYVWVSKNNKHTLMKVTEVKSNGGNKYFDFFLHKLEIV